MYMTPQKLVLDALDFFFPMETMAVPPMMDATCTYSRIEYDAPPRNKDPSMTGAIFPDLASVATGKDNPLANDNDVQALDVTWDAPETANIFNGIPGVAPVTRIPIYPTTTLANDSSTCKNHA